ncbi:PLxRFG domain-containing protein [Devosia crocina]|nr:PLxRFG domain-containing protein [Devosia crocina]
MAIVVKSGHKFSDPMGLYRNRQNPLDARVNGVDPADAITPISATAPGEDPAIQAERLAVEQANSETKSTLKRLNAAEPGRYEAVDEPNLTAWQEEWQARQPGWLEDTARIFGGSVAKGTGSIVSGLGNAITALGNATTTRAINSIFGTEYGQANPLGAPADWINNLGEKTQEGVSYATREAIANSTPEGDLLDPSTWSLGKAPSLPGYAALTLDVFGQMTPVIAAAVVAGPAGGAVIGGLQGGGAAGQQAEAIIDQMAEEPGLLEKESAFYREQIAAGRSHEEALAATKAAAAQSAFLMTAPISGLGGFATSKILDPATAVLQGKNIVARILGRAGLSAVEEGVQEAAETVATNAGVNVGAGTNLNLTDGTFGDFLLGALAGSGPGAVAGAFSKGSADTGDESAAPVAGMAEAVAQSPDQVAPAAEMAAPPAQTQPPGGVLTRARQHGAEQAPATGAGETLLVNDPALPGQGAGPLHGQAVQVAPNQTGTDPDWLRVLLDDGSEQDVPKRLLQGTDGTPLRPDPQATAAPIAVARDEPGLPSAGQRVIVEAEGLAPFNGQVEQFITNEDGSVEAIVIDDDGEVLQVPREAVRSLNLSSHEVEAMEMADNPPPPMPNMPEAGGRNRQLPNEQGQVSTVVFPDDTHAALYDFGAQTAQTRRLDRATGESALARAQAPLDMARVQPIADALGVRPEDIAEIADDYRYRVQRAARNATAGGTTQMHGLNPERMKAWRAARSEVPAVEGAVEESEAAAPISDDATWWSELGPGARKAALASAGVKRTERVEWEKFTKNIQRKLAGVRVEMDGLDRARAASQALDADAATLASTAEIAPLDVASDNSQTAEFSSEMPPASEEQETSGVTLDVAAQEAATSPANERPEPSQAQKEAGNYKLGHARVGGLDLSIENPAGSERKGVDKDGKAWSVEMKSHYGYIKGTVGRDKDHIDIFVKPGTEALDADAPVFVVDQVDEKGRFDEHKVMLGFRDFDEARAAYLENYTTGWEGLGGLGTTDLREFKRWLKEGETAKPFGTLATTTVPETTVATTSATDDGTRSEVDGIEAALSLANTFADPLDVAQRWIGDAEKTEAELDTLRTSARRVERSIYAKHNVRNASEAEDAQLTEKEQQFLFYGEGPTDRETLNAIGDMIEPIGDARDARAELARAIAKLPDQADYEGMGIDGKISVGRLLVLGSEIQRLGLDAEATLMEATQSVADRYRDADDAEFMVRSALERLRPFISMNREPAPAANAAKRLEVAQETLAAAEATDAGKPGPDFATFRAALPLDESGDPDLDGAGRRILDDVGGQGIAWARLSDSQKRKALGVAQSESRRNSREGVEPVAVITGNELGVEFKGPDNMPALRRAAAKWYDDNLIGTTATMQDGTVVHFNKRGRKESTQGRKGDLLLRSVPAIRDIIEKGEVVLREPGDRERVQERLVIRAPVQLLGRVRSLVVSVHRMADGSFQYDFNTDREDGGPGASVPGGQARQSLAEVGLESAPVDMNIGFWRPARKQQGTTEAVRSQLRDSALGHLVDALEQTDRLRIVTSADIDSGGEGVQGWTDPDGTITLVADQIDSDPAAVLLHEAFHSGAHDLLGSTQWRQLMMRLAGLYRQFEQSKGRARDFFDAARARVESAEAAGDRLTEGLRVEEFAAYAIEEHASAPAALSKWVDEVIGAIKAWVLKRFGRQVGAITPAQLQAIAKYALQDGLSIGEGPLAGMASRRKSIAARTGLSAPQLDKTAITDYLAGKLTDLKPAMLAAIPLNYFTELKRPGMVAVDHYLKVKRQMDAYRGEKHASVDAVAQQWQKYAGLGFGGGKIEGKTRAAALADLMHEATLRGIDPSQTDEDTKAKPGYQQLRERFLAIPPAGRALFEKVRDTYREQADELDAILLDNVRKTQEVAFRRAEDKYREKLEEIKASDLKGLDKSKAEKDAQDVYQGEMRRATYNMKARMTKLRLAFEASRVPAPYFPLARFGQYFVTVRDVDGTVVSFSKRETDAERRQLERSMKQAYPNLRVESGLMAEKSSGRDRMDPRIVAEIESLLGDADVDASVMDAIWQRYLESMPDLSARKRFIHRKGIAGFDGDALRTFASNQFHAAHQMARLKFGIDLQELSDQAVDQAKEADDPIRGMQLANELSKRHAWVMNPTGSQAVQAVTSTMFTWYLAASPAAAIVNMAQTPMIAIPVLGARMGGVGKATAAIAKASADVIRGKGSARNANLTAEEMKAMEAFYESGMIDRTQAHDLAGVGEVGLAYSPLRHKIMAVISWAYHNVEVWNREVTALAAYRLAREQGHHQGKAIDIAHDLTWQSHFDYSNASRPRVMQGDVQKIAFVFMSHQVNMWYRLFRDIHQAVKGESPQARKEARYQLAGIMGMTTLFAGTTGLFGYNVLMALAGLAFDDDDDPRSFKEEMEGHIIDLLGKDLGGIVLKGAPGHLTGVDLTSRLGMPDFFVRAPNSGAEGKDWFQDLLVNAFGVVPATFLSTVDGAGLVMEGKVARGLEVMAPKAVKDAMQAWRYWNEGVLSRRGDVVLAKDGETVLDGFIELIGFTPARVSETYERMGTLKDAERHVLDERRELMNRFALAIATGDPDARKAAMEAIRNWNRKPYARAVPITSDSLTQSLRSRARTAAKREDGVLITDPELSRWLRAMLPERVY